MDAVRKAIAAAQDRDLVLITGSFYLLGDIHPEALLSVAAGEEVSRKKTGTFAIQ